MIGSPVFRRLGDLGVIPVVVIDDASRAFRGLRFVPTGGTTADGLASYLAEPSVLAVGGSWLVSADLLAAEGFAQITDLAAAAVRIVRAHARA